MADPQGHDPSPYPRADLLPILTLFLLLLAFFILLGTISKFEVTRTQVVLGSLNATFRTADLLGREREFGSLTGQIIGAEHLQERMEQALRTAVGIDLFQLERLGSRLQVTFATAVLFRPNSPEPLPGLFDVSETIAEALSDRLQGLEYLSEVHIHPGADAGLALARAAAAGSVFAQAGLQPSQLAIGLAPGSPAAVDVVFRTIAAGDAGQGPPL